MFQNPEKERQIPETVFESARDMLRAVAIICDAIERNNLPTRKVESEVTQKPTVPVEIMTHSAEVIDLAAERLLREARQNVEAA